MTEKDGVSLQAKMKPRYTKANAELLGNPPFWRTVLEQSDNFAFHTPKIGENLA